MPIVDMPLEQLYKYRGTNPLPADFDSYWERALAELNETDLSCEITLSEFQAPGVSCYDVWFTGVKNCRVYAKLLKPKNNKGKMPAVIQFHGYGRKVEDWTFYMPMVALGFTVAVLDCRGQYGISENKLAVSGTTLQGLIIRGLDDPDPDKLYYRQVFLDTVALARIVMDLDYVDETRVATMGASQGGALALACAALEPRITKVAVMHPFLCDYKRIWEMDLSKGGSYFDLVEYFRHYDPCHDREDDVFSKLGYIDIVNFTPRIKGEVFLSTGLADKICPPSTVFAAYNGITSKKNIRIYPDFEHEELPGADDNNLIFLSSLL